MTIRSYREEDLEAVRRVWREIGWLDGEDTGPMDCLLAAGETHVGEIHGEPECVVINARGSHRYLNDDLPLAGVMGVATSPVARKQGLAGRVTARAIAKSAADGAAVIGLGMFEQGFYDLLGFGTGGYDHLFDFAPAHLRLPRGTRCRPPRRLDPKDPAIIHASRGARRRCHGAVSFDDPEITRAEILFQKKSFGLGYFDGANGELTHHIWLRPEGGDLEEGPYIVAWLAYQTDEQLLELLAVIKSLEDQIHLVKMTEPPDLMFQTLLSRVMGPIRTLRHARFEPRYRVLCWWQMRISDLVACLARTHLTGGEVRFNLELDDPIESRLEPDAPWRGVGGAYLVTLGPESSAERGRTDDGAPTMRTSVNAFTRLWLGVRPATELAITDEIDAPRELLEALDQVVRVPEPHADWEF